jgi:hypothetical protein
MAARGHDTKECFQQGTLIDYFNESQKPDNGRILNVLDLPLGWEYRPCAAYQ